MHISRAYLKPSLFIGSGVLLVFVSGFLIFHSGIFSSSSVEILDAHTDTPVVNSEVSKQTQIFVEVAGAVEKPGVYELSQGARVQDALERAGNVLETADINLIEKTINKASRLSDGQKIYIPKKGENAPVTVMSASTTSKLININSASESELESLPGVGPATAAKIMAGRPYGSLDEITSKKAVGSSVFEKIKDLITAY
jgi:competence protein ComEA